MTRRAGCEAEWVWEIPVCLYTEASNVTDDLGAGGGIFEYGGVHVRSSYRPGFQVGHNSATVEAEQRWNRVSEM